uniref:Putative secreted protein n=1 Tax=Ixodes ricinus TaxID=34613 RepID=A0A6B0UDN9_IXORI
MFLPYPSIIATSRGLTLAACILIRTSLGHRSWGTRTSSSRTSSMPPNLWVCQAFMRAGSACMSLFTSAPMARWLHNKGIKSMTATLFFERHSNVWF